MVKYSFYLTALLLTFFSCKNKVEKIKPETADISESIYASGTIKSDHQYQAFATVNGIIRKVLVSEGDFVKKGSPILVIANEMQILNTENAQLSAAFADLRANQEKLNDAATAMDIARNKMQNDSVLLERQKSLWNQEIGTRNEMEQRELSYKNARKAYQSAQSRYNDLQRQLEFLSAQSKKNLMIAEKLSADYTLRSDIDGRVYSINKLQGEMVNPQTPLAVIGDAKQFILEMQVDEYDILKVQPGLKVLVTLDSYKGKVFEARVTKINPLMNERSKTFLVEAAFNIPPPQLYPNISFEANIVLQSKSKVLLIPRNYLLNDSFVVKANGDKVPVQTGLKDYRKVEILSGITVNDELIKPKE